MRLKVGDFVLVEGHAHLEKAEIVDRTKGIFTLDNGIKMHKDMTPLNSKLTIKVFDEEEYNLRAATLQIPKKLDKLVNLRNKFKRLPDEAILKLNRKLEKLIKTVESENNIDLSDAI